MTPLELQTIKDHLNLRTQGLANILGITYQSVRNYEAARRSIPQSIKITLEYIKDYYDETGSFKDINYPGPKNMLLEPRAIAARDVKRQREYLDLPVSGKITDDFLTEWHKLTPQEMNEQAAKMLRRS